MGVVAGLQLDVANAEQKAAALSSSLHGPLAVQELQLQLAAAQAASAEARSEAVRAQQAAADARAELSAAKQKLAIAKVGPLHRVHVSLVVCCFCACPWLRFFRHSKSAAVPCMSMHVDGSLAILANDAAYD